MDHGDQPEFAPGVPEEVQSWYRNLHDKAMMSLEERQRRNDRFFDEMSQENLVILKDLMQHIDNNPDVASYMIGYIGGILRYKFNACQHCGENHDDKLFEHLGLDAENPAHREAVQRIEDMGATPETVVAIPLPSGTPIGANHPDRDCSLCRNDRFFDICNHPSGSHGQAMGENCPDPLQAPCPACSAPTWAVGEPIADSPCCGNRNVLLFLPDRNHTVCSSCGKDYVKVDE